MKTAVLDIGGTSIKSGIYEDNKLTDVKNTPTQAFKGGQFVVDNAINILKQYSGFDRIGISTAGQVDFENGSIKYANSNIPYYTGMKVRDIIEKEFGVYTVVENDVNAAAIGEANFGAGREFKDFLCLTYGTGIGGAIVINNEIYRGAFGSAGEFGAIVIHPEDRDCRLDMYSGCYEKYASTTALVKKVSEIDSSIRNGKNIFDRIDEDKIRNAVDEWILEIVNGLTSLIHIFNPECIVLGGGIMSQKYILDKVNVLIYNCIMKSYHKVVLKQAELGNSAGMLGAAYLALDCRADK